MANAKWLFFTIPGSVRSTCEACIFLNEGNAFWLVIDVGHNVHLPRIKGLADTLLVPSPRCFCKGSLLGDNHRANYVDKMVRNIDLSLASLPHFSELLWKNKSCRKHTQQGLVVVASYPCFFLSKFDRFRSKSCPTIGTSSSIGSHVWLPATSTTQLAPQILRVSLLSESSPTTLRILPPKKNAFFVWSMHLTGMEKWGLKKKFAQVRFQKTSSTLKGLLQ